jgi:fatty-acid desaturase
MKWYEIDFNWYFIWGMKKFGLAKQLRLARITDQQRAEDVAVSVNESQTDLVSA